MIVDWIKEKLSNYPRLLFWMGKAYHILNYYKISQSQLRVLKKQVRLHRYFAAILGAELDYLRKHCRNLEVSCQNPGDLTFRKLYFPYMEVLNCSSLSSSSSDVRNYKKEYVTKNRWAGISEEQAFLLEVFCLNRLKKRLGISNNKHYPFPEIVGVHERDLCVELSDCGRSLDQIVASDQKLEIPDHQQQLKTIVSYLCRSGVMHLDLRPDGKNLCVDEQGNLSLIDFDIACCVDTWPMSFQIKRRLDIALRYPGGYEGWAMSRLNRSLGRHSQKLKLL